MNPVICMVAPNGARRNKTDHQQIPLTADELAYTAEAVMRAGASAMHLHVRDASDKHTLSAALYREAIAAIRDRCGEDLLLQLTTEAAGIYSVQQQLELVYALQPQAVSLSVRELARADQKEITELDNWMREQQVLPQWILYSTDDLQQYQNWLSDGVLCGAAYPVLFVLGDYIKQIVANIDMLAPFISDTDIFSSWMVCAFGHTEQEIMKRVIARGGHIRVGFENNLWRADQQMVADNAELVTLNIESVREQGLTLANIEQTRQLLTPDW